MEEEIKTSEGVEEKSAPAYEKYRGDFEKLSKFNLIAMAVLLVSMIIILFLPMFKIKIGIEDITVEQLERLLSGKGIKKTFSIYDEIYGGIKDCFSDSTAKYLSFLPVITGVFYVVAIITVCIQGYKSLKEINGIKESDLVLRYNEMINMDLAAQFKKIQKGGALSSFLGVLILFAFDIFEGKILYSSLSDKEKINVNMYAGKTSGVNVVPLVFGIILFVVMIYVTIKYNKMREELKGKILAEAYKKEAEQKEEK